MNGTQTICLAAAAALLLGAGLGVLAKTRPAPDDVRDETGVVPESPVAGPEGKAEARSALAAVAPRVEDEDEIEDTPEFFATLVEEAQPALAQVLEGRLLRDDQNAIERELRRMRHAHGLSNARWEALRGELAERSALSVAAEIDAIRSGELTVSDAWESRFARREAWMKQIRGRAAARP